MFNRLKASLAGDSISTSDNKSPQPSRNGLSWNKQDPRTAALQQQQRPSANFLPPFFSNAPSNNGSENRAVRAPASSSSPQERSFFGGVPATPAPPPQERSFFSNLLPQASPPKKPSPAASPQTIRSQASALLKLATPPLSDRHNNSHHGKSDTHNLGDHGMEENGESTQRETLEHQINRRDAYIARLQHDLHRMQTQLSQYQKDNGTLRRQQLESTHRHGIAIKLWRRTNDGLGARVECFENETTPAAAREIANLIRDAAPPNKDSAYLMMLQDQLAKANIKLDHLGSQTEIVLHKGEEVVESLREEMNEVIRERCRMELELLDQERMLEDDMRRMVLKTERRLKRVQGEIDFLEKNAVEVLKNQEEEDTDTEGDESVEKGEGKAKDDEEDSDTKQNGEKKKEDSKNNEEEGEGDDSGDGSGESSDDEQDKTAESKGNPQENAEAPKKASNKNYGTTPNKEQQHTPEVLRKELRKIAMDRDRSLSVLQKKLREKNEEFHSLMRLRETREKSVRKMEAEKRDREEWERSRSQANEFM
mmetsp:Transcript_25427/g.45936  ORF Transcript_25427/g.45936 Transcript_25427/m.45936 type:complete len:537 (+) Transcript_25427:321-1931(+)|eukprot:CAMPEP_0196147656 /NCGR_PEP_ID=MMETSP0910-20130528/25923_1 /TAXON_ID=49265 /ORGANISM="Thalassiosira rotula, Strain GSO102" /LENGTH=536 /DNA_ID=CAMNT_0041410127 /DNA_START=226 /DNA_END=1836 /DNA_ORIENTATION=+